MVTFASGPRVRAVVGSRRSVCGPEIRSGRRRPPGTAGRVARELIESAALLDPITGDLAGWQSFHRWLTRYSEIYDKYEPVFVTLQTAAASDQMVASGAAVVAERSFRDERLLLTCHPS